MAENRSRRAPAGSIYMVEKSANGWITIRGIIGTRHYLYYSKREAVQRYRKEVLEKRIVFGKSVVYVD